MTNEEYMTIVNKVAFKANKAKPKMETYKDDYNMGVYVGLLEAVEILRGSYKALEPCEDWKFYYKHGYAQARNDVLDKIRAEIIELRSEQNVGVLECLDIIDKYKTESEDKE